MWERRPLALTPSWSWFLQVAGDPQLDRSWDMPEKHVPMTCTTSTLDVVGGFVFLFLETSPDDSHMQPCGIYCSPSQHTAAWPELLGPHIQEELATALLTQGHHPTDKQICYSTAKPPSHCYHYHHVHPTRMPFVAGRSHPELGRILLLPVRHSMSISETQTPHL